MACEGHVTSCDFSSSWVCPAVDEERQLWDTSLEAADCKVPSNTAGMIHCAPTSPDVIHKMNTTKPFISLFYFCVLFQRKGQGVINGGGLRTHYNYPISAVFSITMITQVDSLTASPSSEWHAWCMCAADAHTEFYISCYFHISINPLLPWSLSPLVSANLSCIGSCKV